MTLRTSTVLEPTTEAQRTQSLTEEEGNKKGREDLPDVSSSGSSSVLLCVLRASVVGSFLGLRPKPASARRAVGAGEHESTAARGALGRAAPERTPAQVRSIRARRGRGSWSGMPPFLPCLVLLAHTALAQAAPRGGEVVSGPAAQRIDAFLARLAGFDHDGSILIEQEGELRLRKGYGYADRTTGRAYTADTVFEIGSLAKQFTAAAVLELERRGRLALSDPLAKYFLEAPADKRGITLEQLLTHTAGLAADFPVSDPAVPDYDDVERDAAVARILAQPLEFAPGSSWSYSNCGYVLLAAIVQAAAEQDFREFVRAALFVPAGMKHTGFWGSAPHPKLPVALGHDAFGNVLHDPARMRATWFDLGGGEVWTTLDDLRAWMHALAGSTVLDVERIERLLEPR